MSLNIEEDCKYINSNCTTEMSVILDTAENEDRIEISKTKEDNWSDKKNEKETVDKAMNNNVEIIILNNCVNDEMIHTNNTEIIEIEEQVANGHFDSETQCEENDSSSLCESQSQTDQTTDEMKSSTVDFVGLEQALTELNVKEPFLEELCTKMGTTVVNTHEGFDVDLKQLSKDDSTDFDVSYTDSISESDVDLGSSTAGHRCSQEELLKAEIDRLKWRVLELEKEAAHEFCKEQMDTMNKTIDQLKLELDLSKQEHALDVRTHTNDRAQLESKLESLKKDYETANRDREAAVMRYAIGEMEVITQKKDKEAAEKKLKECIKERDVLAGKLKIIVSDKARVCQILDNKSSELAVLQKEVDQLKEEVNSRDIKIKWMQNKIKAETDARKEAESKIESMEEKVREAQKEIEQAKSDALDTVRKFHESEDNKAYTLGQQLKEQQVKFMLLQHEQEDKDKTRQQLQTELETCKENLKVSLEENNALALKVNNLEKERLEYEVNLSQLKQKTDTQSKTIVDLNDSVKDLEALRIQLHCEQERVVGSQGEMERLRQSNLDLVQDMESCRKREADMLEFTQKLTAKNVRLQSEFTAIEARAQQLECEEAPLQRRIVELEGSLTTLEKKLEVEKSQRTEEGKMLARHLAEKTSKAKSLEAQVEQLTNEIQLVKRKNAAMIKELNRELAQYRRRVELVDNAGSGSQEGSRTSSCNSLNETQPSPPAPSPAVSQPTLQVEPNRQALVERIVKLQRENAKYQEKIDFLEEHGRTLVEEVQKKSKILQGYILREEAGALSSSSMDLNKAELAKHGGIMASVYGSKAADGNMTLELSLEINRKLQAVLEDTLLKNITLKENIDTLGDEIARLAQRRQHS